MKKMVNGELIDLTQEEIDFISHEADGERQKAEEVAQIKEQKKINQQNAIAKLCEYANLSEDEKLALAEVMGIDLQSD